MTIAAAGKRLDMLTGELLRQWDKTKPYWRDAKSQAFEETCIEPITTAVTAAVKAAHQLDELIAQIRHDCT